MKKIKIYLGVLILLIIVSFVSLAYFVFLNKNSNNKEENNKEKVSSGEKVDDWIFDPKEYEEDGYAKGTLNSAIQMDSFNSASESTLGFSTGGAKDINNFRENIDDGFLPLSSDITYEGIFYDYNFELNNEKVESGNNDEIFIPSYSTAISKDPISNEKEYYLSVGLDSNIKESDFQRNKLNLVLVLDVSGSMDSYLDSYYYDKKFDIDKKESENKRKSKMKLAEESINVLIDQLKDDDSFGVVLFDDDSYIGKEISLVGETDLKAIKKHILEVEAMGGTNFESGYETATDLLNRYEDNMQEECENRIIVITDAMPNYGASSSPELLKYMEENASKGFYTTFIGVGVDFNSEIVKDITDVKGANYYSVLNEKEFKKRMGEEFEYMVTPLVYDLDFKLNSQDYEILSVYGTDSANSEKENIMHVNTLFPSSKNDDGEVKGGIVLLKLKRLNDKNDSKIELIVTYEDVNGEKHKTIKDIYFENEKEDYYDNTGIRKGIVLSRYVNLIKNWIEYERTSESKYLIDEKNGIKDVEIIDKKIDEDDDYYYNYYSNENERMSTELKVSYEYKEIFKIFIKYMNEEMEQLNDYNMENELDILNKLI